MSQSEKHTLTDKLKLIETQIHEKRIDMKATSSKLQIAYDYEDELVVRMSAARARTEAIKKDLFAHSSELSKMYDKMKDIFDVFTGNFYKHG